MMKKENTTMGQETTQNNIFDNLLKSFKCSKTSYKRFYEESEDEEAEDGFLDDYFEKVDEQIANIEKEIEEDQKEAQEETVEENESTENIKDEKEMSADEEEIMKNIVDAASTIISSAANQSTESNKGFNLMDYIKNIIASAEKFVAANEDEKTTPKITPEVVTEAEEVKSVSEKVSDPAPVVKEVENFKEVESPKKEVVVEAKAENPESAKVETAEKCEGEVVVETTAPEAVKENASNDNESSAEETEERIFELDDPYGKVEMLAYFGLADADSHMNRIRKFCNHMTVVEDLVRSSRALMLAWGARYGMTLLEPSMIKTARDGDEREEYDKRLDVLIKNGAVTPEEAAVLRRRYGRELRHEYGGVNEELELYRKVFSKYFRKYYTYTNKEYETVFANGCMKYFPKKYQEMLDAEIAEERRQEALAAQAKEAQKRQEEEAKRNQELLAQQAQMMQQANQRLMQNMNPRMMNMNPQMMNPQMMNPQMMNPQMMNPQMMNPQMMNMNPQMQNMNPQMMNPQMMPAV